MRIRLRKLSAAAAAVCLLAACGSTLQGTATTAQQGQGLAAPDSTATTGPSGELAGPPSPLASSGVAYPGSTAAGPGATAIQTAPVRPAAAAGRNSASVSTANCAVGHPIRIGYTTPDTSGLSQIGAISNANNPLASDTGQQAVDEDKRDMNALIAYANSTGGLDGCKIVGYPLVISAADLQQSARQAKCVQATEDDKVQAYIDNDGFFSEQDFACFAAHHVTYVGWGDTADRAFLRAEAPYVATTLPAVDRESVALVQGLHRGGYFSHSPKVGVVVDDLPTLHKVYEQDMLPAFRAIGVTPTVAYVSPLDESQQQSESANAIVRFRSQHIDHVVFLANILVFESFSNEAQSQQWHPRYGIGDYQLLASGAAGFANTSQMTNTMAESNGPTVIFDSNQVRSRSSGDISTTSGPNDPPGLQFCLAVLSKETKTDYHKGSSGRSPNFNTYCDHFFLWLFAARAAPDSSPQSWGAGLASLGTSYKSAAVHATRFGQGMYDGASDYRIGVYASDQPSCYCYRAIAEAWFPMPY